MGLPGLCRGPIYYQSWHFSTFSTYYLLAFRLPKKALVGKVKTSIHSHTWIMHKNFPSFWPKSTPPSNFVVSRKFHNGFYKKKLTWNKSMKNCVITCDMKPMILFIQFCITVCEGYIWRFTYLCLRSWTNGLANVP